jgi:C-terminal processing protease CtpA/Prc
MKRRFLVCLSAALILLYQPTAAQLTTQQQKNLTAFTRLYGYTRFFHPSDEAATLDWDGFAVYGAGKVMNAKDDKALISTLKELFHPFAPAIVICPDREKAAFSLAAITPADTNNYKPIAWQHFGIELNSSNSVYKSIRINRPAPEKRAAESFAPVMQSLSAAEIKGKAFRFSGWMKVDSTLGGAGHFWMRIEKKGQVTFFYNMDNRPATSGAWKEYSFTGQADKDADNMVIGAFLGGKGSLLIDNLRLSVKEGDSWKDIPLANGSFEKDSSSIAKGWYCNQKLAGYHFATETADTQDSTRAFSITSVKDTGFANKPIAQPLYDQYPKPGEYVQRSLGAGISCIVPLALYGTKEHTYPVGDNAAIARLEPAIRAAAAPSVNGDDVAVRLGDVIISWNIFRHFFTYWEDASATPEQLLDKALAKAAVDKDRYDFLQTLQLMTAPLNDGHIYITLQKDSIQRAFAPLSFTMAEGQLVIEQVLDKSLSTSLSPGDVVQAVNGKPAAEYIAALDRTVSGSRQLRVFRDMVNLSLGIRDSSLRLTVQRQDGQHTVRVAMTRDGNTWYAGARSKRPVSGWLRPGIFYIDIEKAPMDSINVWMPQLTQAKAIICDLRGYPNANHGLINHLLDKKEDTKWMFVPRLNYPDYEQVTYQGMGWEMAPQAPHLDGKIFFLTDGSAISYAESFMGFIKDFHLATIVGQPTAGTNGNINPFGLPGGYRISWTGMLVKDHNGGRHHLIGIEPDVPVQRTVQGIKAGKDEFLEKALELAGK